MSKILEMKARRAELAAEVNALAQLEAGGTELSAEQLADIEAKQKEFDELGAKINRAEAAEHMAASAATQVETLRVQGAPPASTYVPDARTAGVMRMAFGLPFAEPKANAEPRPHHFGRLIAAVTTFKGMHPVAAAPHAAELFGEDIGAVLADNVATGGGILIPQNLGQQIIERLTPMAVVRQLGAEPLPLPQGGNLTLGRNKEGMQGSYVTQAGNKDTDRIAESDAKFESVQLKSRTFAGLMPINNDFLRNANNDAMLRLIEQDAIKGLAAAEDAQFLRGSDNGGKAPKGLLNWALAANKKVASVLSGTQAEIVQKVRSELSLLILLVESGNSMMLKPGWAVAPRTRRFLMALVDGNGNKAFPEMEQGLLMGYPLRASTNIPVNLGAGTNESEIYFGDWADFYIGEDGGMEFAVATEASWQDVGGNQRNAFQENVTLLRAILRHDFAPRHVENVAVLTAVKWGA
jgi:HK97 family phage major capsid protein